MPRFKNYLEWVFYFLLFSAIAIFQATFVSALPPFFSAINLPLIFLLFSFLFFKKEIILILAILMGFWLDLLGFDFFGLHITIFLLIVLAIDLALNNWLTNKSLYSFLVLAIVSTVLVNIVMYLIISIWSAESESYKFFLFNSFFWRQLFWQLLWSTSFMLLFFNLANYLSKNLKSFFLEKK